MKRTMRIVNGEAVWDPPFTEAEKARHGQNMRDMLDSGRGPVLVTDNTFWQGQWERNARLGAVHAEEARRAGVSTAGKVYISGLAEFPGDPRAWVDGRGDLKRICEEKGYGCKGAVNVEPVKTEPEEIALAPDIVENEVQSILADHPEPQTVDVGELRQEVYDKRKPPWAK